MSKIIKQSEKLRFRQAEEADLDYIMATENDADNVKYIIPYSREVHAASLHTKDEIHIIVETADGRQKVGFLMIAGLNNLFKEIEFRRIVMAVKGKGYGRETMKLLKAWAFEDLGYHRAWLDCKDYNVRALHLYESEGFVREGLIRETIIWDGKYESLVILGILENEYKK